MTASAVIVGGGIHGCSAALHLARRGVSCVVLEKDTVGRHASGVNAGGVRRLGRHPAEVPLSVAAMEMWWRIVDLVDDDCGFVASGQVKVAESETDLSELQARADLVRSLGFDHEEVIDGEELFRLVPSISRHCVGALVCRRDGFALPYHTTLAYRRKAESLGVRFHEHTPVMSAERHGTAWRVVTARGIFEAPTLINCAGAWGNRIAAALGESVPMRAVAPMMMVTARAPPFLTPVVGTASRPLSFKQMANGTVVIGGGHLGRAMPDNGLADVDVRKLKASGRTVCDLFPIMRHVPLTRWWAGLEGMVKDGLPAIGASTTAEGVFHAFGFSTHGFQLGPVVGRILADLVIDGGTNLPIQPFRLDRFAAMTRS